MGNFIAKAFQFLFLALFVAILGMGVVISYPKYRQRQGLYAEKERRMQRIEAKRAEIAEVRDRQRRFNSDREFVEDIARRNHYLYPGELVFEFGN